MTTTRQSPISIEPCISIRSYNALVSGASSKMSVGRLAEARRDLQKALELNPPAEDRRQIEEFLQSLEADNREQTKLLTGRPV